MKNQNKCKQTANGNFIVHSENTYFFASSKWEFIDMTSSQMWGVAKNTWDNPVMDIPEEFLPLVAEIVRNIKSMTKLANTTLAGGDLVEVVFDHLYHGIVKEGEEDLLVLSAEAPEDEEGWTKRRAWTCTYIEQDDPTQFGFILVSPVEFKEPVSVPIEKVKLIRVIKKQANAIAA